MAQQSIPFFRHDLTGKDVEQVADVLDSPFLTSGEVGKQVETQLTEFFGVERAFLTNSWTNGAVAVLLALGIGQGDEVIVPAMTFIASANVVELVGAKPVFVDVDAETLMPTAEAIREAVTRRCRAVIVVHLYGQMCDVAGIQMALADRPEIAIIEDAAHCFEGTRNDEPPGRHSDAAIFSFYATKNVTCGEGGAVITNDNELADKVAQTRLHGMSASAKDRFKEGGYRHWDMEMLGTKANLPDILAALLPKQIATIRQRLPKRQDIAERYRRAFAGQGIRMPAQIDGVENAEHIFPIHLGRSQNEAIPMLNAQGISVTVNYRSVPSMTYYRRKYGFGESDFPVSQAWGDGTITLPFYPSLSEMDQDRIIEQVLNVAAQLGKS